MQEKFVHHKSVCDEDEKDEQRKKKAKEVKGAPKARQTLEKFEKWLFLFLILGQTCLSVSAAAKGPPRKTECVVKYSSKKADGRRQLQKGGNSHKGREMMKEVGMEHREKYMR